jgi:predicted permease
MLAATASPVALFALGSFLHGKFKKQDASLAVWTTAAKLLVFPLAVFLLAKIFNLSAENQSISALISTMPVAVTCFVIAEKYKLNQQLVANAIVLSTAVSIATIPLFLIWMM